MSLFYKFLKKKNIFLMVLIIALLYFSGIFSMREGYSKKEIREMEDRREWEERKQRQKREEQKRRENEEIDDLERQFSKIKSAIKKQSNKIN